MQLAPWYYDRFIPSILLILYFHFFTKKTPRRELASELERSPSENRPVNWSAALRENRLTNCSVTELNEKPAANNETRRRIYRKAS